MQILTAQPFAAIASPDVKTQPDSLPSDSLQEILWRAYELPGMTLGRHRWLHHALMHGRSLVSYSLPEVIHITGQTKRHCRDHLRWAEEQGIDDQLLSLQEDSSPPEEPAECGKSISPYMLMSSSQYQNIDIDGSAEGETDFPALDILRRIGWGHVNGKPLARWSELAGEFIEQHGADRILEAYAYAQDIERKKGPGHIKNWPAYLTGILRNPDFQLAEPAEPTVLPALANGPPQELEGDPAYETRRMEIIHREILPIEEVLVRDPVEREHLRSEWAGHRWLAKCAMFKLEEYRDFLWEKGRQVAVSWVKGGSS